MNNEVEYSENVRNVVRLLVEMYKVYDIDLMYAVEFEHEARRYDPTGNLVVYYMMWNLFAKMFGEHLHNDAILGVYNYWRIVLLIFWQYAFDLDETGYEATSFFAQQWRCNMEQSSNTDTILDELRDTLNATPTDEFNRVMDSFENLKQISSKELDPDARRILEENLWDLV